jgi:UDP-N-acetylglucosamine 3-dehydrogenase
MAAHRLGFALSCDDFDPFVRFDPKGVIQMKLALCIVGCGQFARTFVQGIQPLRDEIDLFFASRDLERARAYAAMFQGSGAFGSYEAAAADPRVEAMYLCTPHHLHQAHVAIAAQAGKHILVEKPIARTLEEGRAIIAEAQRTGVTLMVAENYRFMAAVRQCKALIERGMVGGLRLVQQQEEAPFQPDQWRSRRDLNGGGVFIDGGVHKVHLLRYLAGEPEHIYAASLPQALDQHEGEDGVVVMTRGASGVVGLMNHAWTSSHRPLPPWVSVSGTRGRIYFEVGAPWLRIEQGSAEQTWQFAEDYSGLTPMVQAFRDSIRTGQEPEMSGAEGLRDLAVVLKAYESMEQGVSLPLQWQPLGACGTES